MPTCRQSAVARQINSVNTPDLTMSAKIAYTNLAPTKTVGVGFGDSNCINGVHTPAFRLGVFLCLSYMAVCVGRPQGLPVPVDTGSPTPRALPPQFGDFGGNDVYHLSTEVVMTTQSPCLSAQDLIQKAKSASLGEGVPLDELLPKMSPFLTYFIELILSEFDYSQHPKSNLAVAARGIATMVDYFETYQGEQQ